MQHLLSKTNKIKTGTNFFANKELTKILSKCLVGNWLEKDERTHIFDHQPFFLFPTNFESSANCLHLKRPKIESPSSLSWLLQSSLKRISVHFLPSHPSSNVLPKASCLSGRNCSQFENWSEAVQSDPKAPGLSIFLNFKLKSPFEEI
jgi:hypothetical protein